MSEYRGLLERAARRVSPAEDAFEKLARRRAHKERNRRIVAGTVGIVVAVAGTVGVLAVFNRPAEVGPAGRKTTPAVGLASNGKIAFLRGTGAGQFIYSMNPDGSRIRRLTKERAYGSSLAWSPDGTRIAFDRGLGEGKGAILVMNGDGTGERTLVDDLGPVDSPTWSPNGDRIAFSTGDGAIYVVNADGTGRRHLGGGPTESGTQEDFYTDPDWSPDGEQIAFVRHNVTGQEIQEIYTMKPDGTGVQQLTAGNRHLDPAWSPDGTRIAYTDATEDPQVMVMNADGTGIEQLTEGSDYSPDWSPDGSKIVFTRVGVQSSDVYVARADGTGQTRLTDGPEDDFAPSWQPLP